MTAESRILDFIQTPHSLGEIIQETGYSQRQIQRILTHPKVFSKKAGNRTLYAMMLDPHALSIQAKLSQVIPETANNPGLSGSEEHKFRNHVRIGESAGQCEDIATSMCPLSYAELEMDMIQFVLLDQQFRDLLHQKASSSGWEVRSIRGMEWLRIPGLHLTMQIGRETVTFYSDEPGDMSTITSWVRQTFANEYSDINSLIARIKNPRDLSSEELTVVITHEPTIVAIRSHIQMLSDRGVYMLPCPNENTPGLKIYEPKTNNTMRVEFIIHNFVQGIAALNMRDSLIANLPRIHTSHGLFWEFVQKYYSHMHHPLMIDTGGHEFNETITEFMRMHMEGEKKTNETFEKIFESMKEMFMILKGTPAPVVKEEQKDNFAMDEIEEELSRIADFNLEKIIGAFKKQLNLGREAVMVYLAAFSVWQSRQFRGKVIKEDIASILEENTNEPLDLNQIAVALKELQRAGLMAKHSRYEVYFTDNGTTLGKKLLAKKKKDR